MAKDLFSDRADLYAQYRPTYPDALFEYIFSFVKEKCLAWDCATGNGQAAMYLANYFQQVEATDISEAQLYNAIQKENIRYQISTAESTPFADNTFDLITVATAYHWLHWDAFFKEATRDQRKPDCVVAAWSSYTMEMGDEKLQQLYKRFYWEIVGPYWDPERKHVDDQYQTVVFDFAPLPLKAFDIEVQWSKQQVKGYWETWSSTQKYTKEKGYSPLSLIEEELDRLWNDKDVKTLSIPLCLRLGRVVK